MSGAAGELEPVLREVVEALAPIVRAPCSEGEAQAAAWLAERLRATGAEVSIEPAEASPGYAPIMARLSLGALLGSLLTLAGLRRVGGLLAAASGALIADDASNGIRPFRRRVAPAQPTQNVVATLGDPDAERTVVVLAHHDAAPTGAIFDPTLQRALGERFPGIIERIDTALPQWWPVLAGPLLTAAAASRRRPRLAAAGALFAAGSATAFADIARNRIVPGANDNLSACAVLVALAEALAADPVGDTFVVLASCGAEEVLQGGIYAFRERWLRKLDRERTYVVIVDTVGSPRLIMLEGEGPFVMEDYTRREFRDMVARTAQARGIGLRRGMRARASTDAVLPSRMGFPTVALSSMDRHKALSNYHLMSDVPENLDYSTVADCARLTEAVIRELADGEPA